MPLLKLVIFWVIYYFLHSFLVTENVQNFFLNNLNISRQTFRLVYVILSLVLFVAILFYLATMNHHYFWNNTISKFMGLTLTTYGLFVIRKSYRKYFTKAFLGLADPVLESRKLITEGIQGRIRHPLYAGSILLIIGFFLYMPTLENLITVLISLIYIFIGIYLEEKKLVKTFGKAYLEYKSKVPMIIPRIRK